MNYWNKLKKFLDLKIKTFRVLVKETFYQLRLIWSDPLERYLFLFLIAFVFTILLFFILSIQQNKVESVIQGRIWKVKNGNTFVLNHKTIKLYGVEAPELEQQCEYYNIYTKKYAFYNCGRSSRRYLQRLVKGKEIICEVKDEDKYGEFSAICYTAKYDRKSKKFFKDLNINKNMVYNGYAVANTKDSRRYIAEENRARHKRNGIWQGNFIRPEKYKRQKKSI